MLNMSTSQFRWVFRFVLTLGVLTGLAIWTQARLPGFRQPPFDFSAMTANQLFVVDGLTRRQEGSVKLGYAETSAPPTVGLYGNHVFRFFGGDAFGRARGDSYFFNYWFANLALPEIYRYLLHIERLGRLPRKLILVQITSPNIDNGLFIINFGYELPPDLLLIREVGGGVTVQLLRFASFAWQVIENWLHETMNYNTFVLGLTQGGYEKRLVDPTSCQSAKEDSGGNIWLTLAPTVVRRFLLRSAQHYCQSADWWAAFRRDGSNDPRYSGRKLIKDEDPLRDTERGLSAGDEYHIANYMLAINEIGRREGVKVAFVVPPAFESNRENSVGNQIFDRALALTPGLTVIDNRSLHRDPSLFVDYLHPSPKYFEGLVAELQERELLEPR
jgi:hypothetical protein